MNLLSFRTPAFYAVCHRCGNALTHGEEECPHCGTDRSRALSAPNSVDFNIGAVLLMPGLMFVPYPSVPEEVDAAMNIARARARVVRRVAFGVAGGSLLAVALALTYAPGLRSPVVQRLAALPEPARTPAFIPVATGNAPKAAAPASTTTIVAAAKPAKPALVSVPMPPAVIVATPPAIPLATPPAVTLATHPAVILATPPAPIVVTPPALAQNPTQIEPQAPSQAPSPTATLAPATNATTEMIASIMNKLTTAAVALRAEISTLAMSPAAGPVTTATSIAPSPATAPAATTATTTANETNAPSPLVARAPKNVSTGSVVTLAQSPVAAPAPHKTPPPAPVTLAQNTATTSPSTNATTVPITAPVTLAQNTATTPPSTNAP